MLVTEMILNEYSYMLHKNIVLSSNEGRFEAEECGKAGELLGDKMHYLKFYERDFSQD